VLLFEQALKEAALDPDDVASAVKLFESKHCETPVDAVLGAQKSRGPN
jgi:hypothetical protein